MAENAIAGALDSFSRSLESIGRQNIAQQEVDLRAAANELQLARFQEGARQFDEDLKLKRAELNATTVPLGTLQALLQARVGNQPGGKEMVQSTASMLDLFNYQPTDRINAGLASEIFRGLNQQLVANSNNQAEMRRSVLSSMTRMDEAVAAANYGERPVMEAPERFSILEPILFNADAVGRFHALRQSFTGDLEEKGLAGLPAAERVPTNPKVAAIQRRASEMAWYMAANQLGLISDETANIVGQRIQRRAPKPATSGETAPGAKATTTPSSPAALQRTLPSGVEGLIQGGVGALGEAVRAGQNLYEQGREGAANLEAAFQALSALPAALARPPVETLARPPVERGRTLNNIQRNSQIAADLIKQFESPGGQPALQIQEFRASPTAQPEIFIGHGHNLTPEEQRTGIIMIGGNPVNARSGITEDQANALLLQDMQIADNAVTSNVTVPLTPQEHAALVSFVYNIGAGNWRGSRVLRLLNSGDKKAAFDALKTSFTTSRGVRLSGLENRRQAEARLALGET